MKEFTFESFKSILEKFRNEGYSICTVLDFTEKQRNSLKSLILRHDVDRFPKQTLKMAEMESEMGISATYYFRVIPSIFKADLIKEVVSLGHEIGYHYEDLTLCKGNFEKSIEHFQYYLEQLREFYPVKTICMHGSPLSKWDNKKLWDYYNYRKFGIIADTSFDIDYHGVFYVTDNGRAWNKTSVSVRDKVKTPYQILIRNSDHLKQLISSDDFPNQVMINAHPDTFFDYGVKWYLNNAFISAKNFVKWFIVRYKIRK